MLVDTLPGNILSDSHDKLRLVYRNPNDTSQMCTGHNCHLLFQQRMMCMPRYLFYQQTFHCYRQSTTPALFRWQTCSCCTLNILSLLVRFEMYQERKGGSFLVHLRADAILLDTDRTLMRLCRCQHETFHLNMDHMSCQLCQRCKTGSSHFLSPIVSQRCSSCMRFAP